MADDCQSIVDRIEALKKQKEHYQEEFKNAPSTEKAYWKEEIDAVNLDAIEQQQLLDKCRKNHPLPVPTAIGFELYECLDEVKRQRAEGRLTTAFEKEGGIAHSDCIDGHERLGIWVPSKGEEKARRAALGSINVIKEPKSEMFGQSIRYSFLLDKVNSSWEKMPKKVNDKGLADEDGPNILYNLSFRLEPPNRIITTITGKRQFWSVVPDVQFTAITTDTLVIKDGTVDCETSTHIDTDVDELRLILEIVIGSYIGYGLALFQLAVDIWDNSYVNSEDLPDSFGRRILFLFPSRLDLGSGDSLVMTYERVQVHQSGILAGGIYLPGA